jgi:hypothetical protein
MTTSNKNNKRGYAPVRVEKIEEAKKILEIINVEERINPKYKTPTMLQRIYNIFIDGRKKLEDGLSIKELALILYPDLITIDQMIAGKDDYDTYWNIIWPTLKKTRTNISRFRSWKKNKEIVLYPRKSPCGKWLYYNVLDKKEFEEVELRSAKVILSMTKQLERKKDTLEMSPKERAKKEQEFDKELEERVRKRVTKREERKKKRVLSGILLTEKPD